MDAARRLSGHTDIIGAFPAAVNSVLGITPAILILEPRAHKALSTLKSSLLKSVVLIAWLNKIAKSNAF